jgi:hypothetical protein
MPPRAARLPPAVPCALEAIEGLIGDVAAAAVAVLGQVLQELKQGGRITAATGRTSGELVAMLHKLKLVTADEVDFINTVQTFGITALRSRFAADVVALDTLIASVLEILAAIEPVQQELIQSES